MTLTSHPLDLHPPDCFATTHSLLTFSAFFLSVSYLPTTAAALESARSADGHSHGMGGSSYCHRLQAQVSQLGDMLKEQRERQGLLSCFSLWRSRSESVVIGPPKTQPRVEAHQQEVATKPTECTNRSLLLMQFAAKAVWASSQVHFN